MFTLLFVRVRHLIFGVFGKCCKTKCMLSLQPGSQGSYFVVFITRIVDYESDIISMHYSFCLILKSKVSDFHL